MPIQPFFSTIRPTLFLSLFVSLLMLVTACQKDSLQETYIEAQPIEETALEDAAMRQLVLTQVLNIPANKTEHPKLQQLAIDFLAKISETERQTLTSKISTLKLAKPLPAESRGGTLPTTQQIVSEGANLSFGQSLAEQGDFLFVGGNGSVHIYHQSNGKYTEQQVITGDATGTTFLNIYDGIEYVGVTMSFSGTLTLTSSNLSGRLAFTAISAQGDQIIGTRCDYVLSPS